MGLKHGSRVRWDAARLSRDSTTAFAMRLRSMADVANGFATIVADSSVLKRLATNISARGPPPFLGGHNQLPLLVHDACAGNFKLHMS